MVYVLYDDITIQLMSMVEIGRFDRFSSSLLQEAIYHKTPLVGLPLVNDQKPNMLRAARDGYAVMLDWDRLTADDLVAAKTVSVRDARPPRTEVDLRHVVARGLAGAVVQLSRSFLP